MESRQSVNIRLKLNESKMQKCRSFSRALSAALNKRLVLIIINHNKHYLDKEIVN